MRAVADDHAAAQSVGIPLDWIWFVVWLVAGLVALVAATVWGTKLGVQFSITFLALKALPVLIIGGFTSVPGAIVGGLIVGAGEKLAEAYLGPFIGGGIEYWFAYVLALVVLMARPQGLFGERIIERIMRRSTGAAYRETGQFKTSYAADMAIFPIRQDRIALWALLIFAFIGVPVLDAFQVWPLRGEYLHPRHPHSVPDPVARRRRPEHPHRLLRPAFARQRRVHGDRRLQRLQVRHRHRHPAGDLHHQHSAAAGVLVASCSAG